MTKLYSHFETGIEKYILPAATKFGQNKVIQAISGGLMYTLPLTLGASVFSILANFPIPAVDKYFSTLGLTAHFNAVLGGTLNAIALFIAFSIPYAYTKLLNRSSANPLIAAMLSAASFIIMMPQTVGKAGKISALSYDYLGSSGMFVAIILGLVIARIYVWLSGKKRLVIHMPDGVPPMVSQSFEPLLVSLLIILGVVAVRIVLGFTPLKNIFSLVQMVIGGPLLKLGSSAPALIAITVIANGLFFFGIHPNAINSALMPLLLTFAMANVEAAQKGLAMPYKDIMILNSFLNNDAVGSTLSLMAVILIFCKSKRYRSFSKVAIVPNFFNINEPVIFGLPIMLNPVLLLPFLISTVVTASIGYLGSITGFIATYNQALALGIPWTMPKVITSFFTMGWQGVALRILCFVLVGAIYLPFIKALDKKELDKEKLDLAHEQLTAEKASMNLVKE
ncbi:PTS sugar transporter subunit IIC [Schleiferilactobacillus perolens]|uniref:Permease IIC component n=1 Tax=Schleiferilactobacillus perolens DSM 12744 TaxID=1423792 RepID=A0A0R1N443_9LACO|nr:PTS transporter subunit EIIC [Schleiferilactobacillus perolens]KRL14457.1 PTS system iic component [Schleiferilactobacillus perolens DSM 12744]